MTKFPLRIIAALALLALTLSACSTNKPPTDELVGTWYQNGGPVDLIWEFHADGTVVVHSWSGTAKQMGVYHHLQGGHVALDFDGDAASVVTIAVDGKHMMMTNPGGDRTMLERK